jgi:methylaspartate ammonia-lyase
MNIVAARFSPGLAAFFFDDQQAIKQGASQDGFVYTGSPLTPGFTAVRQPGECVCVQLELEDGSIALGDCAAVQYSGAGGRDPLFRAQPFIEQMERHLRPWLEGRDARDFLINSRALDALEIEGRPLHTAIRYGVSQALLDAAALAHRRLQTEVLCADYGLPRIAEPVPLFAQCGDERYTAVDRMILKRVDALPHGLINNIPDKLGHRGERLLDYVGWLVGRIQRLCPEQDYRPVLHIDTYGTIGIAFGQDPGRIADYLTQLGEAADPHALYIEGPVDAGSRAAQIDLLGELRARLKTRGSPVRLVADEWCNTYEDVVAFSDAQCCDMVQIKTPDLGAIHNVVDAIRYSAGCGIEAYQGGTCNETDVSARACVHLALAARPTRLLVKPGMGFDEGMTVVANEMHRALSTLRARGA